MGPFIAVVTTAALLIGVLGGYLWWGRSLQRLQGNADVTAQQQADADALRAEVGQLQSRMKATEEELRQERERRQRLEGIVSQGRK